MPLIQVTCSMSGIYYQNRKTEELTPFFGIICAKKIDFLHNYRRPILITDPNPVYSGNKFVQIKS